ncbi:MAG: hypothetical protein AAGF88_10470 [Pseudomonadota bacterium]
MTEKPKKLVDTDISTVRKPARRHLLGLMAAGGAAVVAGTPGAAQGADADSGAWADQSSCPRGSGGEYTGSTDADNGAVVDAGGYGRGEPYC